MKISSKSLESYKFELNIRKIIKNVAKIVRDFILKKHFKSIKIDLPKKLQNLLKYYTNFIYFNRF